VDWSGNTSPANWPRMTVAVAVAMPPSLPVSWTPKVPGRV
jgi:hypothetical protein